MGTAHGKSSASLAPMAADSQEMVPFVVAQEPKKPMTPGEFAKAARKKPPTAQVNYIAWYVSEGPPESSRADKWRLLNVTLRGTYQGDLQAVATSAGGGAHAASVRVGAHSRPLTGLRVVLKGENESFFWRAPRRAEKRRATARGRRYRLLCFRTDGKKELGLVAALEDSGSLPRGGVLWVAPTFAPPQPGSGGRQWFALLAASGIAARQLSILDAWRRESDLGRLVIVLAGAAVSTGF